MTSQDDVIDKLVQMLVVGGKLASHNELKGAFGARKVRPPVKSFGLAAQWDFGGIKTKGFHV